MNRHLQDVPEITIADVARAAGVSISTVSRILNDKPDVAERTRQRVLQVIEKLGYAPHAQAQRLAAGRSHSIALLYSLREFDFSFTYKELDFVAGAATAASKEKFFFNFVPEPVTQSSLLGLYRSAQVEGVILMQICLQDWRVDLLRENNYPFVMIGRCADNTGLSFIDLDFEGAVMTAFDYLVELGHRHIAFLNLSSLTRRENFGPTVRSFNAFQKVREKYGDTFLYREVNTTEADCFETTLQLLAEQPKLTAIFSKHDSVTVGIVRALQQQGRRIPEDFSVMAIAIDQVAQLISPPLTSIDFPTYNVGYQAAKMLISKLKQEPIENEQILLPPKLIVRQSTGPI
jgi:DNA-binding LacI/PurR family transcriptional regulator